MQKRLSLADLKAKAEKAVLENAEIYMGGEEAGCHVKPKSSSGASVTKTVGANGSTHTVIRQ